MSVREYIGARYVPLFAEPLEWDGTKSYEPLTIVLHQGASYTSRQAVPIGIDIANETFWALTGNYNAQVEQYRQEVNAFDGRITANATAIYNTNQSLSQVEEEVAQHGQDIAAETSAREAADTALGTRIDAEASAREAADTAFTANLSELEAADTALGTRIDAEASAREAADTALGTRIDTVEGEVYNLRRELPITEYAIPKRHGIIRKNTGTFVYGEVGGGNPAGAQGMCEHDGYFYVMIRAVDDSLGPAYVFRKEDNVDAPFVFYKEVQTYHSADMIWIPSVSQYWISKGTDGVIFRLDEEFNMLGSFTLGNSSTLLAYDKKTQKVYANNYSMNYDEGYPNMLYEVNPETLEATDLHVLVPADDYKQSITAYDGVLYVLFSHPSQIIKIDIATGRNVGIISIPEETTECPMGETEGIDTNWRGEISLVSYVYTRYASVRISNLWKLNQYIHSVWNVSLPNRRDIYVDSHTDENLESHQQADGTQNRPFPTIDEALLYQMVHPTARNIMISGDHSMEHPWLLHSCSLESLDNATLGAVHTEAAFTYFKGLVFKPLLNVNYLIQGYRNGPITVTGCSKDTSVASATNSDIGSQYPINTTVTNPGTL